MFCRRISTISKISNVKIDGVSYPDLEVEIAEPKYAIGRVIDVYYNPENPQEAVLEPGGKGSRYIIMPSIFCILAGLYILIRRRFSIK